MRMRDGSANRPTAIPTSLQQMAVNLGSSLASMAFDAFASVSTRTQPPMAILLPHLFYSPPGLFRFIILKKLSKKISTCIKIEHIPLSQGLVL